MEAEAGEPRVVGRSGIPRPASPGEGWRGSDGARLAEAGVGAGQMWPSGGHRRRPGGAGAGQMGPAEAGGARGPNAGRRAQARARCGPGWEGGIDANIWELFNCGKGISRHVTDDPNHRISCSAMLCPREANYAQF